MKQPAFQFYPGDWRRDPAVQALSYHDRGVWFEMICLMWESPERGRLALKEGTPMPEDALARLLGLSREQLLKTIATLESYGVCSKDKNGAIFNRRMVRDERIRMSKSTNAKIRWDKELSGLHMQNECGMDTNPYANAMQKGGSSSSSSTSSSEEEKRIKKEEAGRAAPLSGSGKKKDEEIIEDFLAFWSEYPNKSARMAAAKAFRKAVRSVSPETLLSGLRWANEHQFRLREPDKIPHATTWLNQCRWTDAEEADAGAAAEDTQTEANRMTPEAREKWLAMMEGRSDELS